MIEYLKQNTKQLILVDADKAEKELGSSKSLNVVLLGAAVKSGELGLEQEDLEEAIREKVAERFIEMNLKALGGEYVID
jgi:indolepyruvate ferredoxin oxidoreductase beta subunit